jgi:ribosome-associated translation inhibitor RaiA
MKIPLEITYRNVEKTADVDDLVRDYAEKLEKVCGYISGCRVAIEKSQKHQRGGRPFRVRLDITVPPGHEIVVREEQSGGEKSTPLAAIIKKAFIVARRQAESLKERQLGKVKRHWAKDLGPEFRGRSIKGAKDA